jgi:A/G-specific adenine glycosylase
VVDGNVYRVLSRVFGVQTPIDSTIGKKEFALLAQNLVSTSSPGIHNQAIMEFGALQCVPVNPDCNNCPLRSTCQAFELNLVSQLPVKSVKKKPTHRFFNYLYIKFQGTSFFQKRVSKDVWQNLYEFPLIESDHLIDSTELFENDIFKTIFSEVDEVTIHKISNPMKHVLSHRVIFAQFISIEISRENELLKQFIQVALNDIDKFAVSRLMELFLESEME